MGLHSLSGLYEAGGLVNQAGLNFGKDGATSFDPLSLDPYLLFDTRQSMLGELESHTLDLDPAVPSSLDAITATRSGVATYTDADGVIQSASPDTVRVDHVDGVPMILVEPSATNLFTYSEDFTQWSLGKEGTGEFPVVTSDYAGGPLGGLADRIQFSTGGGTTASDGSDLRLSPTVANGTAFTYSVWLKSLSGSVDVKLLVQSSGSFTATVTPEWQKFTYQFTGGFNGQRIVRIGIKGNDTTTADILAWGAQLEEGSVVTSYIPTSGSTVTRAADNLVIDGSDFTDFYNSSEGTFYLETDIRQLGTKFYFDVSNGSDANRLLLYDYSGDLSFYTKSGSSIVDVTLGGQVPIEGVQRIASSYSSSDIVGSLNGGAEVTQSSPAVPSSVNQISLGSRYNHVHHLNGHLKRLIYWPTDSSRL